MKTYTVTIPIAGHITVFVEANSAEEAREIALDDPEKDDSELTWETLECFTMGNVCYCPTPWKIEVEEE